MPDAIIIISTILSVFSLCLFISERNKRLKLKKQIDTPLLESANSEASEIINRASIKAQTILGKSVQTEMKLEEVQATQAKALQEAMEKRFETAF